MNYHHNFSCFSHRLGVVLLVVYLSKKKFTKKILIPNKFYLKSVVIKINRRTIEEHCESYSISNKNGDLVMLLFVWKRKHIQHEPFSDEPFSDYRLVCNIFFNLQNLML